MTTAEFVKILRDDATKNEPRPASKKELLEFVHQLRETKPVSRRGCRAFVEALGDSADTGNKHISTMLADDEGADDADSPDVGEMSKSLAAVIDALGKGQLPSPDMIGQLKALQAYLEQDDADEPDVTESYEHERSLHLGQRAEKVKLRQEVLAWRAWGSGQRRSDVVISRR